MLFTTTHILVPTSPINSIGYIKIRIYRIVPFTACIHKHLYTLQNCPIRQTLGRHFAKCYIQTYVAKTQELHLLGKRRPDLKNGLVLRKRREEMLNSSLTSPSPICCFSLYSIPQCLEHSLGIYNIIMQDTLCPQEPGYSFYQPQKFGRLSKP